MGFSQCTLKAVKITCFLNSQNKSARHTRVACVECAFARHRVYRKLMSTVCNHTRPRHLGINLASIFVKATVALLPGPGFS